MHNRIIEWTRHHAKIKKLNNQIEHWGSKVKQIKTLSSELKKSLETDSAKDVNEETVD